MEYCYVPITLGLDENLILNLKNKEGFSEKLIDKLEELKESYQSSPLIFLKSLNMKNSTILEGENIASKAAEKLGMEILYVEDIKRYSEIIISYTSKGDINLYYTGVSEKDIFDNYIDLKEDSHVHLQNQVQNSLKRINCFNKDVKRILPKYCNEIQKSKNYVVPKEERDILPEPLNKLLDYYASSDVLSIYFQKWKIKSMKVIYSLGLIVILLFLTYHLLESKFMLLLYIIFFLSAYIVFFISKGREMEIKYLDYRAFAEGLRVQFFWNTSDLKEDVTDYYLYEQKSELKWIENSIRILNLKFKYDSSPVQDGYSFVSKYWVQDQLNFFTKNVEKNQIKLNKQKKIISILVGSTFLIGALLIYFEYFTEIPETHSTLLALLPEKFREVVFPKYEEIFVKNWILLLLETIAAFAAVIENYVEATALSEQVKRYSRTRGIYESAMKYLKQSVEKNQSEQSKNIIKALGKETLIENGEWLLLFRERPIEVPKK